MQQPAIIKGQVFHQPYHLAPAAHLWRLFPLIELKRICDKEAQLLFSIQHLFFNPKFNAGWKN